jgi:tetratricopeptide (TPR) repeat protein
LITLIEIIRADPSHPQPNFRVFRVFRGYIFGMNWRRFIPLLIMVAGIAAYHNSFQGQFILDDLPHIKFNPRIRDIGSAVSNTSRPVVQLSLAVNYAFGKVNPWGYHLFNLVVHLLAGLMLYGVARRTLARVWGDRRPETGDRRLNHGGTCSVTSSPDTDIVGQAPRLADQADSEPAATGAVALQSSVFSLQSSVTSRAHASTLAGVIALIWVVHPLNTQAVTYIIQRGESIMGLFYLLTLYCFIRGVSTDDQRLETDDRRPDTGGTCSATSSAVTDIVGQAPRLAESDDKEPAATGAVALQSSVSGLWSVVCGLWSSRAFWLCAALLSCAAGMATKPIMATAPLMVLLYDRIFIAGNWRDVWHRRRWLYMALAITWLVLPAMLYLGRSDWQGSAGIGMEEVTPINYALTQPGVILHYLRLSVWPVGQSFDYLWPVATGVWQVLPPLAVVSGLFLLTLYLFYRSSALSFPGLWFFAILAMTSSFLPVADLAVEHRMYLALAAPISLAVLLGDRAVDFVQSAKLVRSSVAIMLGLLVGTVFCLWLTLLTVDRNKIYRDEVSLWTATVANRPLNYRAHFARAIAFMNAGEQAKSREAFHDTIETVAFYPGHYQADSTLAAAYFYKGDYDHALPLLEQAISRDPQNTRVQIYLGLIQLRRGNHQAAVDLLSKASALSPASLDVQFNLGIALLQVGRFNHAETVFRQLTVMDPTDGPAHHGLAMAHWHQGQAADAVIAWISAIALDPELWPSVYNLAWVLATHPDDRLRNGPESLRLARRIVDDLKSPDALALEVLAVALAETGQYEEAVKASERAQGMRLRVNGTIIPAEGREERLELFRQGRPYRIAFTGPSGHSPQKSG